MKHLFTLLLLSAFATGAFAQTTALDWQKSDCDGTPYGLYDMCDSGNIVIMEFVMMNCGSCVNAANLLKDMVAEFEQSHPGRVKMFSISFNNTTTCTTLRTWKKSNGFDWPAIANGKEILAQYGEMGMPTIAVVGTDRNVLYTSIGFSGSKVTALKTAITNGLAQSGVKADAAKSSLYTLYPNPATNVLRIETTSEMPSSYSIVDALGNVHLTGNMTANEINTSSLASGAYSVVLTLSDGTTLAKGFTVTR